jgi:hypothetical protein
MSSIEEKNSEADSGMIVNFHTDVGAPADVDRRDGAIASVSAAGPNAQLQQAIELASIGVRSRQPSPRHEGENEQHTLLTEEEEEAQMKLESQIGMLLTAARSARDMRTMQGGRARKIFFVAQTPRRECRRIVRTTGHHRWRGWRPHRGRMRVDSKRACNSLLFAS